MTFNLPALHLVLLLCHTAIHHCEHLPQLCTILSLTSLTHYALAFPDSLWTWWTTEVQHRYLLLYGENRLQSPTLHLLSFNQLSILRRIFPPYCNNLVPQHTVPLVRDLVECLLEILTDHLHSIFFLLLFLGYFMSFLVDFWGVTSLHKSCVDILLLHNFHSCMTLFSFSMQYLSVLFFTLHLWNDKVPLNSCSALKRMSLLWLQAVLHENLEASSFISCPSVAYPSLHVCSPTFCV